MSRGRRPPGFLLHVLAFGSGFAVMTIEIAGARVMAPAYGLSALPWTAVIGVVLGALAAGNYVGGRLADRGRPALAWILAAAGLTAVIPVAFSGLPSRALAALGFIPGAVASAVVLFSFPVFALGMVVPYLVRLGTTEVREVGRRAGDVSAAATVGSILGTFVTGFVLLPALPLPSLLACTGAGLLVLAGLSAFVLRRVGTSEDGTGPPGGPSPAVLLLGAVGMGALATAGTTLPPGVLHREESVYASLLVTEREWGDGRRVREMWQNGGSSSAEYVHTGRPAHAYAEVSLGALEELEGRLGSVLVLGGGALTLPVELKRRWPDVRVDVVELDPAATRLARRYFAYGRVEDGAGPRVFHDDARLFLRRAQERYDVVYLDVFDNLVTVPWNVVTVEALELARSRLWEDGVLMANVLSPTEGPGAVFLGRLLATFENVFPAVRAHSVDRAGDPRATGNVLLVAGRSGADLPRVDRPVLDVAAEGPPLTDDHAPVEYLQARVFWEGLRWR